MFMSNENLRLKRIQNQYQEIVNNPPICWKVVQLGDSDWDIWVTADKSCPFWGIPFKVKLNFPPQYPYQKPNIVVQQPKLFFHPNIGPQNGSICEKTVETNNPVIKLRQRIDGFLHVLSFPNPDSPLNSEAAKEYAEAVNVYSRKAFKIFRGLQSH